MSTRLLDFIRNHGIHELNSSSFGKIGSGANGEVWNVKGSDPPIIIKFGKFKNASSVKSAKNEYNLTKNTRQKLINKGFEPFLPSVRGNFYGNIGNGSLFMLNKVPGETLHRFSQHATSEQLDFIRAKLQSYVDALKSIGVVHGDLNPNNIMIEVLPKGDLKVSIIDFGRGRYNTNKLISEKAYSQWPTPVRCKPGKSRYCKLEYTWSSRANHPTAVDNQQFINAVFGKKGGIASRATRLKDAINIISNEKWSLREASNNTSKKGITIKGQKSIIKNLLETFKNENARIANLMPLLRAGQVKTNSNKVRNFILMLRGIRNNKNIPLFTPTTTQTQQIRKLYNTLSPATVNEAQRRMNSLKRQLESL